MDGETAALDLYTETRRLLQGTYVGCLYDESVIFSGFQNSAALTLCPFCNARSFYYMYHNIVVSYLMFVLPDMRVMIRDGKLEGDAEQLRRMLDLPCTGQDIAEIYNRNYQTIQEANAGDRAEMYMQSIQEKGTELQQTEVVQVGDAKSDEECVYAIAVNHAIRRVTVAFRGSVTHQDFVQDAKAVLTAVPNPVQDLVAQRQKVNIHLGFCEYLYGRRRTIGSTEPKKDEEQDAAAVAEKPKYEIILDEVKAILEDHPDYKLYVTGHSLGGALASIFAFEAAARPDTAQTRHLHHERRAQGWKFEFFDRL